MIKLEIRGDLDKEGSFRPDDLRAFRNPKWRANVEKAFSRTPYLFDVIIFNSTDDVVKFSPDYHYEVRKFTHLSGMMSTNEMFSRVVQRDHDGIGVLLLQNEGNNRCCLTPWMLAHRIAHAFGVLSGNLKLMETRSILFILLKNRIAEIWDLWSDAYTLSSRQGVVDRIGTMRSTRLGLCQENEFPIEVLAQFIIKGAVTLNRHSLHVSSVTRQERLVEAIAFTENLLNLTCKDILDAAVGRTLVL